MVDLALTPAEVKEKQADMCAGATPTPSVAKYPWGCCISLEDDTLKKLGLDGDMPESGDMIAFRAIAKVTCACQTERETTDGKTEQCRRVEIQIIDMTVLGADPMTRAEDAGRARRKRMFPSMVADTDDHGE
jgi:hypothetical protein